MQGLQSMKKRMKELQPIGVKTLTLLVGWIMQGVQSMKKRMKELQPIGVKTLTLLELKNKMARL
jgi:hypothetical protein